MRVASWRAAIWIHNTKVLTLLHIHCAVKNDGILKERELHTLFAEQVAALNTPYSYVEHHVYQYMDSLKRNSKSTKGFILSALLLFTTTNLLLYTSLLYYNILNYSKPPPSRTTYATIITSTLHLNLPTNNYSSQRLPLPSCSR